MILRKPVFGTEDLCAITARKVIRILTDERLVTIRATFNVGILSVRIQSSAAVATKYETLSVVLAAVRANSQVSVVKPPR